MTDVMMEVPQARSYRTRTHTVQRGESLSHIARKYYRTANAWQTIFQANRDQLTEPNRIREGMTLRIP